MRLSHQEIESIGSAVIKDFESSMPQINIQGKHNFPQAVPIEQFAAEYLRLDVSFAKLACDGSICGLTAYVDTKYQVEQAGEVQYIPLHQNQVLLDDSLADASQRGRRRFTLAHECAHQILFAMESATDKHQHSAICSARASYSLRKLESLEDWNEWQANRLGAALLMPMDRIVHAVWFVCGGQPLKRYGGRLHTEERKQLSTLSEIFGVSRTAMLIRLQETGFLEEHPWLDVRDKWSIWP